MTSVDRAKQFLQNKARALAVAAAPLATLVMLSTPAKATITSFTAPFCNTGAGGTGTGVSGSCSGSLTPITDDGVNGVSMFGNATATNSGSGFSVSMVWSGGTNGGSYIGQLPVDWDFTVSPNFSGSYTWQLNFDLLGAGGTTVMDGGSGSGTQTFTGADAASVTGILTGYSVDLIVSEGFSPGIRQLNLSVPGGATIDLNPTPEPASVLLVVPGLGLLLLRRRRKKTG